MVRENGLLADALVEHQPTDPNFGPPESWPWWTDWGFWELGPAYFIVPDPDTPPAPTPDPGLPGEEQPLVLPPDDDDGEPFTFTPDTGDDTGEFPAPLPEPELPDDEDLRRLIEDAFDPEPDQVDMAWLVEEHARREYEHVNGFNARFA